MNKLQNENYRMKYDYCDFIYTLCQTWIIYRMKTVQTWFVWTIKHRRRVTCLRERRQATPTRSYLPWTRKWTKKRRVFCSFQIKVTETETDGISEKTETCSDVDEDTDAVFIRGEKYVSYISYILFSLCVTPVFSSLF